MDQRGTSLSKARPHKGSPLMSALLDTRTRPSALAASSAPSRPIPRLNQDPPLKIVRRLGDSPRERNCATGQTCPDIFELSDGNFAVIGREATAALESELPPDSARADYERIVIITRETLVRAKADIPAA